MIKSDFLKFKLFKGIKCSKLDNFPSKVYFSKIIVGEPCGFNFVNIKYNSKYSIFGSFVKVLKGKKAKKRTNSFNFICWSNFFDFLFKQMKYLMLVHVPNFEFLQRSFKKFRFSGASYVYLSKNIVCGIKFLHDCFGEFVLERGNFLFYSYNYKSFLNLLHFIYSGVLQQDFIVLKMKFDNLFINDSRFLFFFHSVGLNKFFNIKLITRCKSFLVSGLRNLFAFFYYFLSFLVVRSFFPLNLMFSKYVYLYASWKRLS